MSNEAVSGRPGDKSEHLDGRSMAAQLVVLLGIDPVYTLI